MRFTVLGSVEVVTELASFSPPGPKIMKIFSLLLLRRNQLVDIETMVEELWGEQPKPTAVKTVRTHIYHLRQILDGVNERPGNVAQLVTRGSGYELRLDPELLDADVFRQQVGKGRRELEEGRAEAAGRTLDAALELWRGPALANVSAGPILSRHVIELTELRLRAVELKIESYLRSGRHHDLVSELRGHVTANPLNEWLQARLIETLHRSGRRDEALRAFRDARAVLDAELGVEPSPELQDLHRKILSAGMPAQIRGRRSADRLRRPNSLSAAPLVSCRHPALRAG
jgi:DNA-binding SARP family transcriptional activator